MDLYDRRIIGWSLSRSMKATETTIPAWQMAVKNRPIECRIIFHSDTGSSVCLSCVYGLAKKTPDGFAEYEWERELSG